MYHVMHHGEIYARGIATDSQFALSAIQKQFDRFENNGILVSKKMGTVRIYSVNKKSPVSNAFFAMVKIFYQGLSLEDKERLFATRRRPRRKGKPVINKNNL